MTFRPGRVAIIVLSGFIGVMLLATAASYGLHWYRVWANNGVWCFPLDEADGNKALYGDDCPE